MEISAEEKSIFSTPKRQTFILICLATLAVLFIKKITPLTTKMIMNYLNALENWFNKKIGWFFTNGFKSKEK